MLLFFCTCAYKTGVATVNEIIIVRQDEGAPLLHLQAILSAGDSLTAVPLGGLEVPRTQPGLINHLGGRQRGLRAGGDREDTDELGRGSAGESGHRHMNTFRMYVLSPGRLARLLIVTEIRRYPGGPEIRRLMNLAVAGKSSHCQPTCAGAKKKKKKPSSSEQPRITVHLAIFRGISPVLNAASIKWWTACGSR